MSPSAPDDDRVGYMRPPRTYRWKKGQSGNPRRRYPKRRPNPVELIDHLLLGKIDITENGVSRQATKLEAILLQLWRKELEGDLAALAARLRFQNIAKQHAGEEIRVTFADTDYTRTLAEGLKHEDAGSDWA